MTSRYELNTAQWRKMEAILAEILDRRSMHQDNRRFVNGVCWVLRSGARWCDMPSRYGAWKILHQRFLRWAEKGIWNAIFAMLTKDRDNEDVMIDSTIVRANQQAAKSKKKHGSKALGRSRGGLTTKIHLLCDALGNPLKFIITGGEVADCTQALPLLEHHSAAYVLADKEYDSNEIIDYIQKNGATPVIPPKKNRIEQRYYDKEIYKDRHLIECS